MSAARTLGIAALALGVAAPFAGNPYRTAPGRIDVAELAGIVAREEDHVDAVQLANWIRERKSGLRVIDVRSPAEYQTYAIPGAENHPIATIDQNIFSDRDVLVLYSEGGAHAAQAWVFLRALGLRHVYFLRGGMQDWLDDVINPVLAADATPQARQAFEDSAELSRYFGGVPRIDDENSAPTDASKTPTSSVAATVARTRRRGC
ncbi:rhodanese-like domain-containing protein [Pseudolysobacter antarcticus]|uniref:Rhodanese-like domain-containing protein n=1 Tax=Pseudolysobacter antarcticus TaxID=2511995 RepID=A0A411HL34_9GAMM|nr:rhodanese-like domain-containing protein [Pseudolysobacter antarcticus]QBB71087.1 rhodanese-like domain-containing protein [Pseudolysobacter antarcticus]